MLDKNDRKSIINHQSLEDLNLISLWSLSGSDWSSIIQKQIQIDTNQPIVEKSKATSKVVMFGVLATLVLLVAVTCSQASEIYRSVQEVGTNSFKELISKD